MFCGKDSRLMPHLQEITQKNVLSAHLGRLTGLAAAEPADVVIGKALRYAAGKII